MPRAAPERVSATSPRIPLRFFWLVDLTVLAVAFLVAHALTPHLQPLVTRRGPLYAPWLEAVIPPGVEGGRLPPLLDLVWVYLLIAPLTLVVLAALGNHGPPLERSLSRTVLGSFAAPLVGLALVTLALFALKSQGWSRLFIFSFVLLSGTGLAAYRILLRRYFAARRAAGYYARNVLLVGLPDALRRVAGYFAEHSSATDYRVVGRLSIEEGSAPPQSETPYSDGKAPRGLPPVLGHVSELGDLLVHRPIHEVVAIPPASNGDWLPGIIEHCDYFGVLLRIVPEPLLSGSLRDLQALYHVGLLRLPAVTLVPRLMDSEALFVKRLIDIVVAATLLVLLLPIFVLTAIAIRITTPHLPVFYRWRVVGYKGQVFTGYKFTTMVADAERRQAELLPLNEMTGPVFKISNDPRVTPLGRLVRKFSLNELPQLWSVLKGDMSLVGPRPAWPHELDRYELWQKRKLTVRPGITCLWQVRGRNRISNFDDWVRMDLEYIDNWSLWLDLKIMLRTAWVVVSGTGS